MSRHFDVEAYEEQLTLLGEALAIGKYVSTVAKFAHDRSKQRYIGVDGWVLNPDQCDLIHFGFHAPGEFVTAVETLIKRDPRVENCLVHKAGHFSVNDMRCYMNLRVEIQFMPA